MKNQETSQTPWPIVRKTNFLKRYVNHLFRCYHDLTTIASHIDKMMAKLY
jgi:hypothetical protein